VPFALVATGALTLCLSGCKKEEPKPELPSNSPAVYMKDEGFKKDLAHQRKARLELTKSRAALVEKMKSMVDAQRAKAPGADDAAIKAVLEKDPEWLSLEKRVVDLNAALEENHGRTLKIVGDRIAPKGVSK